MIEDRKNFFQTQSNIKTFKLEVLGYRLRCHALVELNDFDNFELHWLNFFYETSTCDVEKAYFFYGSRFLKNLSKEALVLNNGLKKFYSVFQNYGLSPYCSHENI